MRQASLLGSLGVGSMVARPVGVLLVGSLGLGMLSLPLGCSAAHHRNRSSHSAARKYGVELQFPRSVPDRRCEPPAAEPAGEEMAELRPAPQEPSSSEGLAKVALCDDDKMLPWGSRAVEGTGGEDGTSYTIRPGEYTFQYDHPSFRPVYGALQLHSVDAPRAKDFIRHASIPLTPSPSGRSVLSEADLDQARNGDVVTRVVFVADLQAVEDRLDNIDQGLREIASVRASLKEQEAYWQRKLTERRVNSRFSDFGWGVDVPGSNLAMLQSIVGPERYHWHRFSEAEHQVRAYEEKIARLDIPERDLKEERDALRQMLQSAEVLHRSHDLLVLAPSMNRPYHDPAGEVYGKRGTDSWYGSSRKSHHPYWSSSRVQGGMSPGMESVSAPSWAHSDAVGEVLMIVQAGARCVDPCGERCCAAK